MPKDKISLNISGMTCVNCSNAIKKVTSKMKGVEEVEVSFASNKGEFLINPDEVQVKDIKNKIQKLGFGVVKDTKELEIKKAKELKEIKKTFIISAILTFFVVFLEKSQLLGELNIWAMFIAASIVQIYAGARFYKHAFAALKNKNFDMNVLVAMGTTAAYGYSAFVVLLPQIFAEHLRYVYFNGSTIIITFILLGKYLEERSKEKATNFLKKMMDLAPVVALREIDGKEEEVKVENLGIDDIVLIKSGEKISTDGVVIEGRAEVDQSALTGESLPITKTINDEVMAGTINKSGFLKVKVTKLSYETMLSNIVNLLDGAQNQKMPVGRFADKIANIFVPSVIVIALLTFVIWWQVAGDMLSAILASISVLIISCPCALGLATPIAIVSAVGRGAKEGILIKNPEVLEVIKDIKYAIFDKTGTLTKGELRVKECTILNNEDLKKIACLEAKSEHLISKAILLHVKKKDFDLSLHVKNVEVLAGLGIKAIVEDSKVIVGSLDFLEEEGVNVNKENLHFIKEAQKNGDVAILAAIESNFVGYFILGDEIKEESYQVIRTLKEKGITTVMLSGDNEDTAKSVASKLDIDLVYAGVLPDGKFEVIKNFQNDAKVLFVGDGINDAPSLKLSNIGMALSSGTDIAKEAGDIVLINNNLDSVKKAINLSAKTMRIIKQNLFWAFIYNVIGIPLAAGALYPIFGVMLTPMYAGMAMSFSSVIVVLNSLRLKFFKIAYIHYIAILIFKIILKNFRTRPFF